jgi:hypothetical protein
MAPKTQKTPSEKKKAAPGVKKTAPATKKSDASVTKKAVEKKKTAPVKKLITPAVAGIVTQGNLRTILAQIAPESVFSSGSVSVTLRMINRVVDTLIRLTFAARPLDRPTLTRSDVRTALRSFLPIVDGEEDSFREHMNDTLEAYFANQARIKAKKATDKALRVAAAHDLVGATLSAAGQQ